MVCRIDVTQGSVACTVHVAGRLAAENIEDLLRVCDHASGLLRIDLTDLLSADADGVDVLRRLTRDGAELWGVAEYLRREIS